MTDGAADVGVIERLPGGAMKSELGQGHVATLAIEGLPTLAAGFLHRQEVLPPAVGLLLDQVASSTGS